MAKATYATRTANMPFNNWFSACHKPCNRPWNCTRYIFINSFREISTWQRHFKVTTEVVLALKYDVIKTYRGNLLHIHETEKSIHSPSNKY